ncbi:hypothetical protein BZG02_17950 [Labilibaculum filiforme]|uniref:DUF2851 domain-containing protein n=1 Tax=Labilibaculum filiforme TaxID=1940526 RepID=A0A2N3HS53_9BACT|nr:DUF2851 family protein [Labilibaculum filiforme]PKQ60880.1 hypothetical protein BZG02_17950 [Labilibaculum filiforme]
MNEDFLQFIWKQNLFSKTSLFSTQGNAIEIIDVGKQNFDSGPDFFDARIRIDNVLWAGNVEIHLKSSLWYLHEHDTDPAYENVVLHVVLEDDSSVVLKNKRLIPCLVLSFTPELLNNYKKLMLSEKWIPCVDEIGKIESFFVRNWLDRMLLERLERKSNEMQKILEQNKYSWEETFYQVLAQYFGMKVNAEPFQQLARSIPMKFLARQKNSLFQLEALMFGQSGLFEKFDTEEEYLQKLKSEYEFLANKYQLKALSSGQWKWLRLRPSNFPTIRIAQFAALVHKSESLFSQILHANSIDEITKLLNCQASEYWTIHYQFGIESHEKKKVFGQAGINALIINSIVPILFLYGKINDSQKLVDKACDFLDQLDAEDNSITRKWKECGVHVKTAYHSQALLQLKSNYCERFNCLQCEFGNRIIRNVAIELS